MKSYLLVFSYNMVKYLYQLHKNYNYYLAEDLLENIHISNLNPIHIQMKQSIKVENTSQSTSVIHNLSIFTKWSKKSDRITQSDGIVQLATSPMSSQSVIKSQKYNIIQWLIVVCSIIGSASSIILSRNYYLLESIFEINLQSQQSILIVLKWYGISLIIIRVLIQIIKKIKTNSSFAMQLEQYQHQSIFSLIILLTLSFYLYFGVKMSSNKKPLISYTLSKINHFITWFILGQISALGGFIIGRLFNTNSLRTYGVYLCGYSYILLVSSIISFLFKFENDLFNILG